MGKAENLSVNLAAEIVEAANSAIAGGEYSSLDHVLHAALTEWKERRERDLAKLRVLAEEGLASGFEQHDGMASIRQAAQAVLAARAP